MSEVNLDQKEAITQAKDRGYRVYRGNPRRLLLDLDSKEAVALFEKNFRLFFEDARLFVDERGGVFFTLTERARWRSSSGKGWHVLIDSDRPLPLVERLLLQATLGSDLTKELYGLARHYAGQAEPSLLFRPPKKAKKAAVAEPSPYTTDDDIPF